MPVDIGLTTLHIIAGEKILLFAAVAVFLFLLACFNRPWAYAVLGGAALAGFAAILLAPLKVPLGGNLGDEQFITAFLMRVLDGQPFSDFYYRGLAPFYPPLYFWIVGGLSWPFVSTGVGAAKIGMILTFALWFVVPYLALKGFWKAHARAGGIDDAVAASPWFWLVLPLFHLLLIDPYALVLKPYETFPALLSIIWIGALAEALAWAHWTRRTFLAFGISGGLLFLTFYFWWFMLIPAAFALALLAKPAARSLKRCLTVGGIMAVVSLPYTLPLLLSAARHGVESWQAVYFTIDDLFTFAPWATLSVLGLLALSGLVGLLRFRHARFIMAAGLTLAAGYAWQAANTLIILGGGKSAMAGKPFLFLGAASLAAGAAYAAVWAGAWCARRYGPPRLRWAVLVLALVLAPFLPFGTFIDRPALHQHLEKALAPRGEALLAENIRMSVPDYRDRVWLTSGTASLNAWLTLDYFIAQNPHFSHFSSRYSGRMAVVHELAAASTPEDFTRLIDEKTGVTGLIFFKSPDAPGSYPLIFWQDAYPNGGKDMRLDIPRARIDETHWQKVKEDLDWDIFIRTR